MQVPVEASRGQEGGRERRNSPPPACEQLGISYYCDYCTYPVQYFLKYHFQCDAYPPSSVNKSFPRTFSPSHLWRLCHCRPAVALIPCVTVCLLWLWLFYMYCASCRAHAMQSLKPPHDLGPGGALPCSKLSLQAPSSFTLLFQDIFKGLKTSCPNPTIVTVIDL